MPNRCAHPYIRVWEKATLSQNLGHNANLTLTQHSGSVAMPCWVRQHAHTHCPGESDHKVAAGPGCVSKASFKMRYIRCVIQQATHQHGVGVLRDEEGALQEIDLGIWPVHMLLVCLQCFYPPAAEAARFSQAQLDSPAQMPMKTSMYTMEQTSTLLMDVLLRGERTFLPS